MLYKDKYELNMRGELTFPAHITEIPPKEFYNDKNISCIIFNENILKIGAECFKNCYNLKKIYFNNCKVTILENGCFEDCSQLSQIDMWPSSLRVIEDRCFAHNFNLLRVPTFPKTFLRFEKNTFAQDWFNSVCFLSDVFEMNDIEDISFSCRELKLGDIVFLLDDWDVDSVLVMRQEETTEFVVWKAKPIICLFNRSNQTRLYKYYDKKSKEFTISYNLRDAKREIDERLDNKMAERATRENWTKNTLLSIQEYGIISHSCLFGLTDWAVANGFNTEQKYSISTFLKYNSENERGYLFTDFVHKYVQD